ncbi:tetratricopeptide repeat protein [Winogradskya consettensis]|uniref:XRE family transcriptional regulator n=1 Tax=Winogradskya consettensis TaxID=113560 RepID=A0A919SAL3_9ACTN|nr:BTAD domain-containing putative transcriptional regulator [Actinoplanes consettensis]GIM68250.1 XRE family transcriptional regulator [Actinoplanes consettensis]
MSPDPSRVRIEGLGPFRAYVDGAEIELGPPKQRATLAVLALSAGTTVSRAELVDGVWGESPPATAAGSLHTYVSGLRRALGPAHELLASDRAGYSLLISRESFDATRAEDQVERARARAARDPAGAIAPYEQALANWTGGTLFAGVPGPFVEQARHRLAALRVRSLVELTGIATPALLPDVTARLLAEIPAHPFDERLRTVTMTALHRGGRTADALTQYAELRRLLAADLGISPSAATQAVYSDILAEDRRRPRPRPLETAPLETAPLETGPLETGPPDTGPLGTGPPKTGPPETGSPETVTPVRPAQLPHDRETFVGRSAELLTLVRSGTGEPVRRGIVLVVGAGGIGKTALAVRGGHLLSDSHPDGQIYLNLRGFDPSYAALTPDTALHQLLLSVGARQIPPEREQRIALWRSLLAGRRMLIMLDNARSADQIEHLLPGAGSCLVIVTSRDRLSRLVVLHDATRIQLGALRAEESLDLLATAIGPDRVSAEPGAARRLTELCDHSPFALQIAAERIVSTGDAAVGTLVAHLEDVRRRLDELQVDGDPLYSVRGVLTWSFAALDADAARAFRLLGVFPGPTMTRHSAAALFGTDAGRAGLLLDTLSARCLLEQDGDRFRMHDLTRVYAAEVARDLDAPERRAALSRVLSWYRAELSIRDPRWCATEHPNLVALVHAAGQTRHHEAAYDLTARLFDYFSVAGQPLEWLELLRVAMRSAEATGDRLARAVIFHHGGVAYARLGQNETAVRQLRDGLELLTGPEDRAYRIGLLCSLTTTLREMKRCEAAEEPAGEALTLARATGSDHDLASAHHARAGLDAATGHWQEAIRQGLAGLAPARACCHRILESALLTAIGRARLGLGEYDAAATAFGEALRISRDIGDRYHEGQALFGLARCGTPDGTDLAHRALARFAELDAAEVAEVRAFLAGPGI